MIDAPGYPVGLPQPIGFSLAYAAERNRLTVAVRLILVIPQLIVISLLGIVSGVVSVIGWCAALILGRLPNWAARFQSGYLGWNVRVQAYYLLLVDAYPPFGTQAPPSYPLQLAVPPPGRLNRAAVFFRIILAIPAGVVGTLASTGISIVSIPIWVMLVIGGRMPRALFQAMAVVLRYEARYLGYSLLLLTPAYPGGLFAESILTGDWGQTDPETDLPASTWSDSPTAPGAPAQPGWPGAPAGPGAPAQPGWPGAEALPRWPDDQGRPGPVFPASSWPVVAVPLAPWAKAIVVVLLVLGLAGQIVYDVYVAPNVFNLSGLEANVELVIAHQQLQTSDQQALANYHSCLGHGAALSCAEQYDAAQGSAYAAYASSLGGIKYPRSSRTDASTLLDAAKQAGKAFLYVSGARSQSVFQAEVSREGLPALSQAVQSDYARLSARLSPGSS